MTQKSSEKTSGLYLRLMILTAGIAYNTQKTTENNNNKRHHVTPRKGKNLISRVTTLFDSTTTITKTHKAHKESESYGPFKWGTSTETIPEKDLMVDTLDKDF